MSCVVAVAGCAQSGEEVDSSDNAVSGEAVAASKCAAITTALNLQKTGDSLGLTGAVNIENTLTKEVVRVFLSQTRAFVSNGREIHDFKISALAPIPEGSGGRLLEQLDRRTNLQLLDIPNITNGCEVAFGTRRLGPTSVLVSKEVASTGNDTVILKPSDSGDLASELKITFHGRNMD